MDRLMERFSPILTLWKENGVKGVDDGKEAQQSHRSNLTPSLSLAQRGKGKATLTIAHTAPVDIDIL